MPAKGIFEKENQPKKNNQKIARPGKTEKKDTELNSEKKSRKL